MKKRISINELFIVFLTGYWVMTSTTVQADETDELQKVTLSLLEKAASQEDAPFQFRNGVALVNNKEVRVSPVSENSGSKGTTYISAARFEIEIGGEKMPNLTFGAIGVSDSASDARKTAVVEWYMGAGQALFTAIGGDHTDLGTEHYRAYAGHMGVRGESPDGWVDGSTTMNQKLISVLENHLPKRDLNTIDLKVAVGANGDVKGQCLINGEDSEQAVKTIQSLDWPTTSSYLFKQAYVLTRKQ